MNSRPPELNFYERIENRLRRIANVLLLNASFIENLGLLNGKMGIAIFFYHYSRHSGNKIYEDHAGELVDEIYDEISKGTPVDFANGLTGIGWGIEYLVKNKFVHGITDEALSEIDTTVYRNSVYRPFLLESGNDLFGYGLYYIARLREHGNDDNNLNTLFKKQHLIYLTDDCERILTQKKYRDYKIESLSTDTINSFAMFLIEMHRLELFPFKVERLFHALPEFIEPSLHDSGDIAGKALLCRLVGHIIRCVKDVNVQNIFRKFENRTHCREECNEKPEDSLVNGFIKNAWQQVLYEPYAINGEQLYTMAEKVFQIIDNEENWNNRLDSINKNNLGLTGLAGIGLGLLFSLMQQRPKKQKCDSGLLVNKEYVEK